MMPRIRITIIAISLCLCCCYGCSVCDNVAAYSLAGQVVDLDTGEGLVGSRITIRLLRDGEEINVDGPATATSNSQGLFGAFLIVDRNGGPCWPPDYEGRPAFLGEPPDTVDLRLVTTLDDQRITIALDADNLSIDSATHGHIELGLIEISSSTGG